MSHPLRKVKAERWIQQPHKNSAGHVQYLLECGHEMTRAASRGRPERIRCYYCTAGVPIRRATVVRPEGQTK